MTRLTIDDLEVLNPEELGKLLCDEVRETSPSVQFIQDILTVGCPIDARPHRGVSALQWAVLSGHLEVVKFLISKGADMNAGDNSGWTTLHYAASNRHLGVVKFLISKGADVSARNNDGYTAWDVAFYTIRDACPELKPK